MREFEKKKKVGIVLLIIGNDCRGFGFEDEKREEYVKLKSPLRFLLSSSVLVWVSWALPRILVEMGTSVPL